jgi:hypothetical protein
MISVSRKPARTDWSGGDAPRTKGAEDKKASKRIRINSPCQWHYIIFNVLIQTTDYFVFSAIFAA